MGLGDGPIRLIEVWSRMSGSEKAMSTFLLLCSVASVYWPLAAAVVASAARASNLTVTVIEAYRGVGLKAAFSLLLFWVLSNVLPILGWPILGGALALACIPGLPAAIVENRPLPVERGSAGEYFRRLLVWLVFWVPFLGVAGAGMLVAAVVSSFAPTVSGFLVFWLPFCAVFYWSIALVSFLPLMSVTTAYVKARDASGDAAPA